MRTYEITSRYMKTIAILPGHAAKSEGEPVCAGYFQGWGEFKLASFYLPELCKWLEENGFIIKPTKRENKGGTTPSYSAKAANATNADIALEWHFNDATATANGCEVLYYAETKNEKGRLFAEKLGERIAAILGVRHRGAVPIKSAADRGWRAFKNSKMPFFMIEPCFAGSNPREAREFCSQIKYGDFAKKAAKAVAETINEVYGKED